MITRPTSHDDIPALQGVVDETEMFPSELLPEMVSSFLAGDGSSDLWLTCEVDGSAVGFCYAVPEKLADGAWNMLAIAMKPSLQGQGHGSALVAHLELTLRQRDQRILIVDTSSADAFSKTREFYRIQGYTQEARIRDFWAPGDDKIVFWKSLG